MSEILTFTPEQFNELIKAVTPRPGLGAPKAAQGLGCSEGGPNTDVYGMLALGSPRLALAKAEGARMVPYYFNMRATFSDVDTTDIPDVGADVKITQDTLVDQMTFIVVNKSAVANSSVFQTLSDFFFNFQSGIEATLDIQGQPKQTIAPKFTPLKNLADLVSIGWPKGFVLTYQQQLSAAFRASVTLPYAPIEVVLTFRCWEPNTDRYVGMTNKEAYAGLQGCGVDCNPPTLQVAR